MSEFSRFPDERTQMVDIKDDPAIKLFGQTIPLPADGDDAAGQGSGSTGGEDPDHDSSSDMEEEEEEKEIEEQKVCFFIWFIWEKRKKEKNKGCL